MRLLNKIAWKSRKMNIDIKLLNIHLNSGGQTWGLEMLAITNKYRTYSLFAWEFRLPNQTSVQSFTTDHFDILFLRNKLSDVYLRLDDRSLWGGHMSVISTLKLNILNRMFN